MIRIGRWCRGRLFKLTVCTGGEEVQRRSPPHGADRNDVHHKLAAGLQDQGMKMMFPALAFNCASARKSCRRAEVRVSRRSFNRRPVVNPRAKPASVSGETQRGGSRLTEKPPSGVKGHFIRSLWLLEGTRSVGDVVVFSRKNDAFGSKKFQSAATRAGKVLHLT